MCRNYSWAHRDGNTRKVVSPTPLASASRSTVRVDTEDNVTMTATSVLRCLACGRSRPIETIAFRCECGGLLEVAHDLAASARRSAYWRDLFESRWRAREGPDASGVWRYREWILPGLHESEIVTMNEGMTRLHRSEI